ncbi:MAG: adenine phosphoribosyltransferase [Candidatus Methylomirabilales bacterium]
MRDRIRDRIRDVPDFPAPGILFKDITPLLADPAAFAAAIEVIAGRYEGRSVGKVCGIEARGFMVAAPVAYRLGAGLVPMRKKGKLPGGTDSVSYLLEYGEATLEVHRDAIAPGERVLIVDDVLATGGTAAAAAELVRRQGGAVAGIACLIELEALNGRAKLQGLSIYSLLRM